MKRKLIPAPSVVEADDWEEADRADAKEVWLATGEMGKFLDAKEAFLAAGYGIREAEIDENQPVWFFDLIRTTAPRIREPVERVECLCHIRDVLWRAGVYFMDEDVMIQPARNRLIISITWPTPARGERRELAWDEWRFQALLDQLP